MIQGPEMPLESDQRSGRKPSCPTGFKGQTGMSVSRVGVAQGACRNRFSNGPQPFDQPPRLHAAGFADCFEHGKDFFGLAIGLDDARIWIPWIVRILPLLENQAVHRRPSDHHRQNCF